MLAAPATLLSSIDFIIASPSYSLLSIASSVEKPRACISMREASSAAFAYVHVAGPSHNSHVSPMPERIHRPSKQLGRIGSAQRTPLGNRMH